MMPNNVYIFYIIYPLGQVNILLLQQGAILFWDFLSNVTKHVKIKGNSPKKVLTYNGTFLFCIFKTMRLINKVST